MVRVDRSPGWEGGPPIVHFFCRYDSGAVLAEMYAGTFVIYVKQGDTP